MLFDKGEIIRLTEEYGGAWGLNHACRLLSLISIIDIDQQYDREAVWLAAHLHDWGAYPPFVKRDFDHALRSRQVAEQFLADYDLDPGFVALVLECIAFHHCADSNCSIEAILLADADALDFLGPVGVLRDFSKNPKNLRLAYEITCRRRGTIPTQLRLEKSKEFASELLRRMDLLLSWFEENSFGHF